VLLLTDDSNFRKLLTEAFSKAGLSILATANIDEALQTVCACPEALAFAIIDFDRGCHGMSLLRAINSCNRGLPIIVLTCSDLDHAAALAYANGAVPSFSQNQSRQLKSNLFSANCLNDQRHHEPEKLPGPGCV